MVDLKSNHKVYCSYKSQHTITRRISCQTSCHMQGLQMGRIIANFPHPVACIEASSTVEAIQHRCNTTLKCPISQVYSVFRIIQQSNSNVYKWGHFQQPVMSDRSPLTSQLRGNYLTVLEPLFSQLNLLGGTLPIHAELLHSVVLLRLPRMQLHSLVLVASHSPCVDFRASISESFSYLLPCGFPTSNSIAYGWHQAPSHAKLFNQPLKWF